jgi:predicted O-methyltransferase YrrM
LEKIQEKFKMNFTELLKAPKNKHELSYIRKKYYNGIIKLVQIYNAGAKIFGARNLTPSGDAALDEIRSRSNSQTDISDHLETLFVESLRARPKLIVELGVGPGESTFVLERVAKLSGARLVSVDIKPERARASSWVDWLFVCGDDVEFAQKFKNWAADKNINPSVDVLFIDTSHEYEHTVKELKHWLPLLSDRGKVFLHDTNTRLIYHRRDHSIGLAPDTQRGVARALENFFGISFNERKDFIRFHANWLIIHYANCNGFTILEKLK